jgi:hypothetical protein
LAASTLFAGLAHVAAGIVNSAATGAAMGEAPGSATSGIKHPRETINLNGATITSVGADLIPWGRTLIEDGVIERGTVALLLHGAIDPHSPSLELSGRPSHIKQERLVDLAFSAAASHTLTYGKAPTQCLLIMCGGGKNWPMLRGIAKTGMTVTANRGFARFSEDGVFFSETKEGFFFETNETVVVVPDSDLGPSTIR